VRYDEAVSEPVEVEVLDRDGRLVVAIEGTRRHSILNPLNVLLFLCAVVFAAGILLVAIGNLLLVATGNRLQRARNHGKGP
jgi:hypothetical protein